jgi:uncharacterized membrane protein
MKEWSRLRHKLFHIGIILKGIDGGLEIIGGILILMISPRTVNRVVHVLVQHELSEDPNDIVANYLIHVARGFSISNQLFGFVYLLSHGVVKILLVHSLWKRRLWSYPVAIVFFASFGIYQTYRYYLDPSFGWVLLTILDVFIISLTWLEYVAQRPANTSGSSHRRFRT